MLVSETREVIEHFKMRLPACGGRFLRVGFKVIDARDAVSMLNRRAGSLRR